MSLFRRRKKEAAVGVPSGSLALSVPTPPGQVFVVNEDEVLRRVVGNLSQPARVEELALLLHRDEFFASELDGLVPRVQGLLDQAFADGFVTNLGVFNHASEVVTAANAVCPIHPEKAEQMVLLFERKPGLLAGQLWYWTPKGYELLNGGN